MIWHGISSLLKRRVSFFAQRAQQQIPSSVYCQTIYNLTARPTATGVPRLFADDANDANGIENFWNPAKRHLRRCDGIPRRRFHLCIKVCEWRFNYRPATIRFSSFGWLAPVSRAMSVELGASSDLRSAEVGFRSAQAEALAKADWFELFPVSSAVSIMQQRFRTADLIEQPNGRVWRALRGALPAPKVRSCTADALPPHGERPSPVFTNC